MPPIDIAVDDANAAISGGSLPPPPPRIKQTPEKLTLGLDPEDKDALIEDQETLEAAIQLYRYARSRNNDIRSEFDLLADFALGKQFQAFGDELNQLTSRPKRNMLWDIVRHKKGLVTEPGLRTEVLPIGLDDGGKAQLAKAALDFNALRRDSGGMNRKDRIDLAVLWSALVGTGILHQGWDPITNQTHERVVDPRMFDPDPDHPMQSDWLYCFETLRLPVATIRRLFPATGPLVAPDDGPLDGPPIKRPWKSSSDGFNVRMRQASGQQSMESKLSGPDFATVVLYWSQGHVEEEEEGEPAPKRELLRCDVCWGEFAAERPSPDVTPVTGTIIGSDVILDDCPSCGFGKLGKRIKTTGRLRPLYPKGRRLVAFSPHSRVLLYKGRWPTPELRYWPYKAMRWYTDPRRWWGIGEPQMQWALQVATNKLLVLLMENAVSNAAPKVVLPRGIGFEQKRWTNIPSEKLIATGDPRLIGQMRAFSTGEVPQSLVFLVQFFIRELRNQGGFDDVALGQIRSSSDLSGEAIDRALSAAEVPVRDHLRNRYVVESQLAQDDLQMIRERWGSARAVRLLDAFGEPEIRWLSGDDLPDLDVLVTADPQPSIERAQKLKLGLQLLSQPDPETGLPILDAQGLAEWVGIPVGVWKGVQARRLQRQARQAGPAGTSRPAQPPASSLTEQFTQAGASAGLVPQGA